MRFALCTIGLCLALALHGALAGDQPELTSETDRISYSLGHQLGRDLQRQGLQPDMAAILRGLQDGLADREPLVAGEEMQSLLQSLKHDIVTTEQEERMRALEERRNRREAARREGAEFLAANEKKSGVTTLPSGLQYRVIRDGTGRHPGLTDTVTVKYRGTLLNGNEFDSTEEDNPGTFRVSELIPGLQEALQLMAAGAQWELYIPPQLGFGRRGALEDQTLIYDIELLDIAPAAPAAMPEAAQESS
jgi:FKBP-type peptidyl-prolyl cis-trans isomerase FklB